MIQTRCRIRISYGMVWDRSSQGAKQLEQNRQQPQILMLQGCALGRSWRIICLTLWCSQNEANLVQFDNIDGLDNDLDGDVDESNEIGLTRRELAQWAVNVVDYIDADAIMTPFRYADGIEEDNVVWGCENPDLIITETLAFHDRAIADTDEDDGPDDNTNSGAPGKKASPRPHLLSF